MDKALRYKSCSKRLHVALWYVPGTETGWCLGICQKIVPAWTLLGCGCPILSEEGTCSRCYTGTRFLDRASGLNFMFAWVLKGLLLCEDESSDRSQTALAAFEKARNA